MERNDVRNLMAALILSNNPVYDTMENAEKLSMWIDSVDTGEDERKAEIEEFRRSLERAARTIYGLVDVMLKVGDEKPAVR